MRILVTGGAGFIGSALVRHLIAETGHVVINLDALTYAGNLSSVERCATSERYVFVQGDIRDEELLRSVFEAHRPEAVMHLAAESHVDRSVDGPTPFIETNIVGTYRLLRAALAHWQSLPEARRGTFRFHHVSTDEVYGTLGATGAFTEETPYRPNSPYSASKAASDHLVRAWHHTYALPVVMSNCSNNYGPYQYPEKLIPVMVRNALRGKPLPVYGNGANIRDWLFVEDHVRGLLAVLTQGHVGESYNIGGNSERTNLQVAEAVCSILDELSPLPAGSYGSRIELVADRPGHDFRYAIDASRMRNELNWQPVETFESGLRKTVRWYLDNEAWCRSVMAEHYDGGRLGLGTTSVPERFDGG